MIERIRRRLTLGYVGIFALILFLSGTAVAVTFSRQVAAQQDELLRQKAQGTLDYVSSSLRQPPPGREGPNPEERNPPEDERREPRSEADRPVGPIRSSTDPGIGLVSLVPDGTGSAARILESSPSATSLGLPFEGPAHRAVDRREVTQQTVEGPGGERTRVVSMPVIVAGGEVAVVQAAQPRRVVWGRVGELVLVLVSVGVGGLALAGVGGLFMSRRAMRPVVDSFQRQRAFIADASHELKTPLALVKINAEVIKRSPADPENGEVVEDQLAEIDRMDALLSDLLVLARLDAGRLDVESKPFDLAAVVGETAGRFLKRAALEGLRLEVDLPDELPACGDPEKTAQVLAALLDNAVRHTPEDGTITIAARRRSGRVEATVTDTGSGIPPEHLPRVFDRFYRAEEARTRKGGGSGLGPAIARDLTRAQEGDLLAGNAAKGGGAKFTLTLPADS